MENRQGILIGSPEAVAINKGWTDIKKIQKNLSIYPESSPYKKNIMRLFTDKD